MGLVESFLSQVSALSARNRSFLGLAISGGADSTALLHLAAGAGLHVHVIHVDHAMRPGSDADAHRVAAAAEDRGVPWTIVRAPVSSGPRSSPEAEARKVRYFVLEAAAAKLGCTHVATAHTMDDQAETVLLRAIRGGRPAGIAPRLGRFIRPLLGVRRADLRAFLTERGVAWMEDPTNADVAFERNWIRAEVMPLLESRRPGVAKALARAADLTRLDDDALDALGAEAFALASSRAGALFVPDEALRYPGAVVARVVLAALRTSGATVSRATVDAVLALGSGSLSCGGGVTAWRVRDGIAFVRAALDSPHPVRLPSPGTVESSEWGVRVRVCEDSHGEPWAWRCTLERAGELWLRARRPGDRVPTSFGTRKVQDVMVDAKLPRFVRDAVPVLVADDRPLAVVGLTTPPAGGPLVVDVEPTGDRWWIPSVSR